MPLPLPSALRIRVTVGRIHLLKIIILESRGQISPSLSAPSGAQYNALRALCTTNALSVSSRRGTSAQLCPILCHPGGDSLA